jgi:MFS family permease
MSHNRPGVLANSRPGGAGHPRGKRRFGAAVALGVCVLLWLFGSGWSGDLHAIVWRVAGLLTCLAGLAVAIGRARVRRGDTWQAAFVAAPASLLGPLSAILVLVPPVRRSLREAPVQLRARGEELQALEPTPAQAAVAYRRGAGVALGLAAAALAFLSAGVIGVWLAFASSTLVGGDGVAFGLLVALVVGMAGFIGVLVAQPWPRVLAALEVSAAGGMVAAMVGVALDGGDLSWTDGNHVSVSFLYWIWALVAVLFLLGAAVTGKRPRT